MPAVQGPFDYKGALTLFDEVGHFCKLSQERANPHRGKESWSEAPWRIPCADQEGKSSGRARASSAGHSAYLALKRLSAYDNPTLEDRNLAVLYMGVMKSLYERRPFISTEGFVGLAPAHSRQDDCICIILGASFPFILRRATLGQYELIGEAYVYGIMDGEGLKLCRKAESVYLY